MALSITATLFAGRRLWKNAAMYGNAEIAAGSGISSARGVAGFPNGETFRIGDGQLNYGAEELTEVFYRAKLASFFDATADYQSVLHPAHNQDRGPLHVFAIRGHVFF